MKHSFLPPPGQEARIFEESAPVIIQQEAYNRKEDFWESNRPELARKKNPNTVEKLMARFRSVPLFYSRTKLVCEKWNGTQRHKDTELYFLREHLPSLYIYFSVPLCLCVQYKGLTDFSQSISD